MQQSLISSTGQNQPLITTCLTIQRKYFHLFTIIIASIFFTTTSIFAQQKTNWNTLKAETKQLGKKEWRPLLAYIAATKSRAVKIAFPNIFPFIVKRQFGGLCTFFIYFLRFS